jgi:predicted ATPase
MLPSPNEVQTTPFNTALARGLAATGQLSEAIALIEHTIRQVDRNGDFCYMPELLRVKGGLLLSMPDPGTGEAEACFMQSPEWSRRQGAHGWELRTAMDLATLLADRGQRENRRAQLQPVYAQFSEGFDTADLKAAGRLLAGLGRDGDSTRL